MSELTLILIVGIVFLFAVLVVVGWLMGRGGAVSDRLVHLVLRLTGGGGPAWESPLTKGSWDDAWVEKAVRAYVEGAGEVEGQHAMGLLWTFAILKERVIPFALAALQDESLQRDLTMPIARGGGPRSSAYPLVRICEVFEARTPVEAIPLLAPHLACGTVEIEAAVSRAIASTGAMAALPFVRSGLTSEHAEVVSATITGLHWCARDRMDPAFREAIWPDLRTRFEAPHLAPQDRLSAGSALLAVDRERTLAFLSDPAMLRSRGETTGAAMKLLLNAGANPDAALLREIVAAPGDGAMSEAEATLRADALRLLGRQRQAEDGELLEAMAQAEAEDTAGRILRGGALEALFHWLDMEGARERIVNGSLLEGEGAAGVERRLLRAVYALELEVNNGGLFQYFFNTAGAGWRDALAGLDALALARHRDLLERACRRFGPEGPAANRAARQEQLREIGGDAWTGFDDLDTAYYALEESVDDAVARYMVTHRHIFQ